MLVIPGVLATASNVGAVGLGDWAPADTAWQEAQFASAYARPREGFPINPSGAAVEAGGAEVHAPKARATIAANGGDLMVA